MSAEAMAKAVETVGAMGREIQQSRTVADPTIFSLAVVMAHPDASLPLLRKAHEAVAGERRLTYAKILGILGDRTGAPTLAAAVAGAKAWDKGYGLTTHRESDNTFSELDRLVLSLGYSGAPEGVPVLAAKIGQLTPQSEMSHFIAAAMALQHCVRAAAAAEPLARLLKEPGFAGHAMVDAVDRQSGKVAPRDEATTQPDTKLNAAFKELLVAGMLVRCGDREGAGRRILEQYCDGVEGHFVRYARSELEAAKAPAAR